MMKKCLFALIVVLFLVVSSACTPAVVAPAVDEAPPAAPVEAAAVEPATGVVEHGDTIFEFVGSDGTSKAMTLEQFKSLQVTEGQAGIKSSTGKITLPGPHKGVSLKDLVSIDPKFDNTMGVTLYAVDGYSITFSYDQVMNGTFIQYDPGTGDELKTPLEAAAMIAYEKEGKNLDPQTEGYLKLVVVSKEPKQVVDGHWAVKFVSKLEVKPLAKEWSLHLEGGINELMDRATFESGSAPNCHGVTWTDENGQEWAGIPLWLLVGRVDDAVKHEGPAFNDKVADAGYEVDVVATDGYSATFDISKIKRVDTILVAYLVDGNPLPEKYFPLRLVGDGLAKNEMVGAIEKIVVHVSPAEEVVEPTAEAAPETTAEGSAVFNLSGLVSTPLALSDSDLNALGSEKITAEHPKKGKTEYEGIRLRTLLEKAGVNADAKKLVLTASDGYKSEIFLAEAVSCADCMVAFTGTPGSYDLVMPGLPSNVWTKGIVSIDIQ